MKITIGNLIDQLSVTNHRIWVLEDICRDEKSTNNDIANAKSKINTCNQLRNDLIQGIDEGLNDIADGKKQKLYRQGSNKIYGKEK
jgi:hypothetical protein